MGGVHTVTIVYLIKMSTHVEGWQEHVEDVFIPCCLIDVSNASEKMPGPIIERWRDTDIMWYGNTPPAVSPPAKGWASFSSQNFPHRSKIEVTNEH